MVRAHPVRDSDRHPWMLAALFALLVLLWVGDCFGQGGAPDAEGRLLLETPCAPSGYARLLREYVSPVRMPDGGTESRFDYARFHASASQRKVRDDLRTRFLTVDPSAMDPASRIAWAVNAYNFFVLDTVIEHFLSSGKDTLRSIADIGAKPFAAFEEERFFLGKKDLPAGKQSYSLNGFEAHYLFHDIDRGDGKSAPAVDPRLHFVLVCAAKGCPPLLTEPLGPEHLEKTLDRAVLDALASPRQLRFEGDTLHVSKIFEWYAADFHTPGVRAFFYKYAPEPVRRALADASRTIQVVPDIEWDWSLNRR